MMGGDSTAATTAAPDNSGRRVRWERGTRYYEAVLHQDLWRQWVVTRVWGSIGTARGRLLHIPCATHAEGVAYLEQITQRRHQRGYQERIG